MTKREILILYIASFLDGNSVYMGGPSQMNRKRADRLLEILEENDLIDYSKEIS
jgi:hypothetical protein